MKADVLPFFVLLMFGLAAHCRADEPAVAYFRSDVLPILEKRCYACHSHAAGKMKGGLNLDSRSGWEMGGETGPAIVPGKPDESLLIKAVRHDEAAGLKMPPDGPQLDAKEIATLVRWVAAGAGDPRVLKTSTIDADWWSLKPLTRPAIPQAATAAGYKLKPIDAFVVAKLTEKSLTPAPKADRHTLIRRVMFDLHGLPPTPQEVATFVGDKAPDAYERLVDRLLASPRYGERWARHWLDTIHFAETHGYEHDLPCDHAWRFRDYVIDSFNRDTPWPRFIREQLAADRCFPDEPRQIVALGFLGAGTFDHSSFTTAPVTFDYLDRDDLVTQTMAAFASTTANCARCHAHKFDPITQEDYYALQAVFAGVVEGNIGFDEDPQVPPQRKHWQALLAAAETNNKSVLLTPENVTLVRQWTSGPRATWEPMQLESFISNEGATLTRDAEGAVNVTGTKPDKDTYIITGSSSLARITAIRLEVLADKSLPAGGPGRQDNGNLHLTEFGTQVFAAGALKPTVLKFSRATADFNQPSWGIERAIDGKLDSAWGIFPEVAKSHQAVFELAEPLTLPPATKLTIKLQQLHGQAHLIGRFRISVTADPATHTAAMPALAEAALQIPADQRTEPQQLAIAAPVLRSVANAELSKLPAQSLVYAAGSKAEVVLAVGSGSPRAISKPKTVNLLKRGDFDKPLAEVQPGSLAAITALAPRFAFTKPDDESERRAALAHWLADEDNPLSWRSIANRMWHYHFGRGLCDTPSDFGRMGGTPSHSELLDWLACELREHGGSLKHLQRLIVTSATYRQNSDQRASAAQIDGDNHLLWRQNRQRLDADTFRDFVLAASESLDLTMGGPSVRQFIVGKPVQLTPTLDYAAYDWAGLAQHRRSIYRFIWRGIADPFMEALDFPDLGLLTPARGFSVSSLQSLTLYNNAFVLHFSEVLAKRAQATGHDLPTQVQAVVRRLLLREPSTDEARDLTAYAQVHGLARALPGAHQFERVFVHRLSRSRVNG